MCCQDIFSELDLDGDEDALRELEQTQFVHSKQAAGNGSPAGCFYVPASSRMISFTGMNVMRKCLWLRSVIKMTVVRNRTFNGSKVLKKIIKSTHQKLILT